MHIFNLLILPKRAGHNIHIQERCSNGCLDSACNSACRRKRVAHDAGDLEDGVARVHLKVEYETLGKESFVGASSLKLHSQPRCPSNR